MRKLRRVLGLSCLLVALLCCLMFQASASEVVASGYCGGEGDGTNLTWELIDDGTLTISGSGAMEDYHSYNAPWSDNRGIIEEVIIDDSVTSIGNYAFYDCESLNGMTIPNGVTGIGSYAFYYCSGLTSLTIGNSVISIGDYAFSLCAGLVFVTVPDGVISIGDSAFRYCDSLINVTISGSVTSISSYAFSNCPSLNLVYFEGNAPEVIAAENRNQSFPDTTTLYYNPITSGWTDSSFYNPEKGTWNGYKLAVCDEQTPLASGYCGGERDGYNLIWTLTKGGTLFISGTGDMAEYVSPRSVPWDVDRLSIRSVIIDNNVTTIGGYTFYECYNLTDVNIPDGVTIVGIGAFYCCESLDKVTIPDSVTDIGIWAFSGCNSLESVIIPASIKTIGDYAFSYCDRLSSVCFEGDAPEIGRNAFAKDIATLCFTPGNAGWTESGAYNAEAGTWNGYKLICGYCGGEDDGTNLSWVLTNDGTLTISGAGVMADYDYDATPWYSNRNLINTIVVGGNVKSIGDYAFFDCDSLTDAVISDSVMTIGQRAFDWCVKLTSVTIPCSVQDIGVNAFSDCDNLVSINVDKENMFYCDENGVLFDKDKKILICYPDGKDDPTYTIPNGVLEISNDAFRDCRGLTEVIILDSVISIGDEAFSNCQNMTSVTIGSGVTTIGNEAFFFCHRLSSVVMGNGVKTIGDYAFWGCQKLAGIILPKSVISIGDYAFHNCFRLTSITIPDSVRLIGNYAFYSSGLAQVYFEGNAPEVSADCPSFSDSVILYYILGTTGWTDSGAYNAFAGTWNGYMLETWKERIPAYTVTFNVNGGSTVEPQVVSYGDVATEPTVPTYDGYIFTGWYSDESLTTVYDFSAAVTTHLTLHAKWEDANILASGYCGGEGDGTNLTWVLTKDGVLTISGTGTMVDYTDYAKGPWYYSNRNSVEQVIIGDGVTTIGSYAFPGCVNLTSVTISDSVETIGDRAFDSCSWLSIVVLGNGVTSIGQRAFAECDKLISVVLPDSVTTIKGWAFHDCDNLTEILVNEGNTSFCDIDGVLFNKSKTILISYPAGKSATSYVIPEGVLDISDNAFYECLNLRDVTIPDSVTTVGGNAFKYSALANVTIGNGVVTIGNSAFANCSGLVSVTIPDSVTTIESYAFQYCLSLASIAIPKNVTTIGDFAFNRCSALTTVTIGSSVTAIKSRAFGYCDNLTSVYFEGNAPSVYKLSGTGSPSFESIVTLYYTPGTTGWTDSSAYNAEAGTWNGYKLEVWRSIVPGDINSDGETNLKDLTRLFQYLADWEVEVNEAVLDVNGDGSINLKDQTRLFQYLADWDVEIYPVS